MKNKLLVIGLAALLAVGIWLPGLSYAQTAANSFGITPGMSDAQIIQVLTQVVMQLLQQIQTVMAQRAGQPTAVSPVAPTATPTGAQQTITTASSPSCSGPTQDITADPLGNLNGTGPFEQLGLATSTHPEILQYRIQWFDGSWSPWYVPGVNDVDWKTNLDGSQRRIWSYFDDHTHEYIYCPSNAVSTSTQSSSITVAYPAAGNILDNSGGKSSGLIANVQWNYSNAKAGKIDINLLDTNGQLVKQIATNIPIVMDDPSSGAYAWKYDPSIPNGSYSLAIMYYPVTGGEQTFFSGMFTLAGNSVTNSTSTGPSITIASPNGGTFTAGGSMTISWNLTGAMSSSYPYYQVLLKSNPVQILGNTAPMKGVSYNLSSGSNGLSYPSFAVHIPSSAQCTQIMQDDCGLTPGTYYVEIDISANTYMTNPLVVTSNAFNVNGPATPVVTPTSTFPFSITSPVSGTTLQYGQTYNFVYQGGSTSTVYSVYLVGGALGTTSSIPLGTLNTATADWFAWTVPSSIPAGSGYQLQFSGPGATGGNSPSYIIGPAPIQQAPNPNLNASMIQAMQATLNGISAQAQQLFGQSH